MLECCKIYGFRGLCAFFSHLVHVYVTVREPRRACAYVYVYTISGQPRLYSAGSRAPQLFRLIVQVKLGMVRLATVTGTLMCSTRTTEHLNRLQVSSWKLSTCVYSAVNRFLLQFSCSRAIIRNSHFSKTCLRLLQRL